MATLLQKIAEDHAAQVEKLRLAVRKQLRAVLWKVLPPDMPVILFGSLTQPGRFNEQSDIDIALENDPPNMSIYQLTALLSEKLGRRVDVVMLNSCRFRQKIEREGEIWTP